MSEISQGPGWWLASDGRWYPPETHPDYVAPPPPAQPAPPEPIAYAPQPAAMPEPTAVVDPTNWAAPQPSVPQLGGSVGDATAGWGATPAASPIPLPTTEPAGPSGWAASALGDPPTIEAPATAAGAVSEGVGWASPALPSEPPGGALPTTPPVDPSAWSPSAQPAMPAGAPAGPSQPWQSPPLPTEAPPAQQPWQPAGPVPVAPMPGGPMPGAPMPGGPQAWQPSGQMAGPGGPPPWQPGTPPGYGAPAAPKGGMPGWLKALLIIGVVLAVLGVGVVGCTAFVANRASDSVTSFSNALEKSFGEADPNDYAVDITACVVTENGGGSLAEGTLKNTSGKKQGYLLTVNFLDTRGNIVSTGTDTVSAQAGKTANWTVRPTTLKDIKTCEIDTVNYTPFDS